jgi:trehalose-phosphatase
MRILSPDLDLERFFERVGRAGSRILLLDYDGTLAPFTTDRDRAFPYPGVRGILDAMLRASRTRVVLVSGRAVRDLVPLLGLEILPEIWGSHGNERLLPDGTYTPPRIDERAARGLADAIARIDEQGLTERCERKPASVAIHTRGTEESQAEEIHARVKAQWNALVGRSGLEIHQFDGGIELRLPGMDKGSAVNAVLSGTDSETVSAYMGDDLTDEDAFRAVKGRGLAILARREHRPTAADLRLVPPDEVLRFLERWHSASGGEK